MPQFWQPTRLTRQQLGERRLAAQPLLTDPEWSTAAIAEYFGVKPSTVRVWRVRLKERGSLEATRSSGRPNLLDDAQVAQIIDLLQQVPDPERFPDGRWTTQRVRDEIGLKFDVWYDHDWIGKLLRRWGFSWQQVEKHAVEQDLEKIDAWLEEELPVLEKKSRSWRNHRVGG
ncbi:IS630 family transposase ISDge17 [Deinococcus xinjiangensis]|uniref:IS630 family transposase ISDge17 n=1 Tax=Deinococcus xinjiangensis TaxID=457454 RepID=A0ABP9VAU6_9DEIO